MVGRRIWHLRTHDLLNDSLDDDALQRRAEGHADRPKTGERWVGAADHLYLTEVAGTAIGCISPPGRSYRRVLMRDDLDWPDNVIPGPDGAQDAVVNQRPPAPPLNGGQGQPNLPSPVVRFWPQASEG